MLTAISSGASHRLRSLEILTPMRADYLPTAVWQPLTPRFENLTSLSLRFTQLAVPQFGPPLRDEAVLPFFNALSALQCLNITFSIDYIRDDFSDIARSILRVTPMEGFMDRLALAQLPKLEKLRLANCTFDSELALIRLLSKHSTTLKEFHLHASTMFNARWIPFIRFLGEAMNLDKMVHTIELQGVQPYTYYGPMMGDQRVYGPNSQVIWKGAATVVELD
nr:hypothetical protein CFP56_16639 [Quercus suber]